MSESHLSNRRNPWKNYGSTTLETSDISVVDDLDLDLQDDSHRHDKGSNLSAYFNIVCVVAGSGTLGIPYAIQQGGWITILLLILSAIMNVYSNIKLIECLYHDDNKSRRISISQVAYDAFGNIGLGFVSFFFNSLSIGCPILYLILSGENFERLFSDIFNISLGMKNWIIICASLMCVPFVRFKTMKEASWLSIFGTISTVMVVFVVFITSIIELPNNRDRHHKLINPRHIPIALATVFFSYGGNIVYPHIEASMKHPKAWPKVFSLATATITIFYLLVCIPAYATYGDATLSPIYKNLPQGLAVSITIIMITIHVLLALPIYQTAFALEIEEYLSINITTLGKTREFTYRAITRVFTVIFTVYIAITFPYFADVMSLLGALGNGVLLNIMPISIWIKLFGWNCLNGWKEKSWVISILLFSGFGAVIGTIDAIRALYLDITNTN
ncbi:transmembrane amino acid transporter protein [Glomus cerebriforme]|uniref:Transmembrane amino acid transporter protein n=1 Tax=Glomus cerebriforme TaxID=658196 RepID=A0A397SFJ0_9GLOM|nr:transmembrane amino acid transporter protein [Glomus cerebriforme]